MTISVLKWSKKIRNAFIEQPVMVSLMVLLIMSFVIMTLSYDYYQTNSQEFINQILVELHGMLFDIAIIGILIYQLNQWGDRKRRIRSYLDEIDDFRHWNSEEAAYRTVGNIKRLNRNHIKMINLYNCFLENTNLSHVELSGSNLNSAEMSHCKMVLAKMDHTRFNRANLRHATLNEADFSHAMLSGANLENAFMIKTNFNSANLIKAKLKGAHMMYANLQACNLMGADLSHCNFFKANLKDVEGLSIEQLLSTKSLYEAVFDDDLKAQVLAQKPKLLEA